jgi:hypothetical protein
LTSILTAAVDVGASMARKSAASIDMASLPVAGVDRLVPDHSLCCITAFGQHVARAE